MILEAVDLLVGFLAALAGENFQVLQGRRVDGAEAVGTIDPPGRFDEAFAGNHRFRQIIAEALERARRDQGSFGHDSSKSRKVGRVKRASTWNLVGLDFTRPTLRGSAHPTDRT